MRVFSDAGDTALVLLVPEAEAAVRSWRVAHDPSAAEGMPAHITVVYPFAQEPALNDKTHSSVAGLSRTFHPLRITFSGFGQFPFPGEGPPRVLWLDPDSSICHDLISTFRGRWPVNQPSSIVPHLTITNGAGDEVTAHARHAVAAHLPMSVVIPALSLMAFDGDTWVRRCEFPFNTELDADQPARRPG